MSGHRSITYIAAGTIILAFSGPAQAAATRTFVSTMGNDANTSANCSPSANCRTFAAALSVTSPGGEIVVLTSGGYGPATISQPVFITAIGVDASISVTTPGGNGFTINTTGNVTLIGPNLHGEGTGANGILVQQVGFLRVYNALIENFTNSGMNFGVSGNLAIYSSAINDNASAGLVLSNASASAYVDDTSFDSNGTAVIVNPGTATIADSSAEFNSTGFFATGGTMTLTNDHISFNGVGLETTSGGTFYFANCLLSNNTESYVIAAGTTMSGTSPGTSLIAPGQISSGTLATATALQ
jgi:hypothetical protein